MFDYALYRLRSAELIEEAAHDRLARRAEPRPATGRPVRRAGQDRKDREVRPPRAWAA
ncbi:hypothetical protein LH646_07795 [Streptomyces sp. WA1-19]|uniref:hypothetical protein n=1 Tax=unclassified Streptomyces TaxID=2593676 RepID=UPI001C2E7A36|nr:MULTISPECIES: hypothetical protein [unclassified Streptomyces]MBV1957819.1 hypothetical protein [Streptomyces sp. BV333]UDF07465.1 hypothetical protein LH646_07795 [Streptomyces sp. WA1-19]